MTNTEDSGVFVRPIYIDATGGDHLAAMMLAQIIYWYRPGKTGQSKLRKSSMVNGKKMWWLVKSHVDWWDELRMTRRQSQRCLKVLKDRGLIVTWNTLFDGHPTIHLRCTLIAGNVLTNAQLGAFHCALGSIPLHQNVQSITETTTETTTEKDSVPESTPAKKFETISSATGKSNPNGNYTPSPTPSPEEAVNASDILNKHKEAWATTLATTPVANNPSAVIARWKHQCVGAGMGVKESMTGKEAGQFKLLFKALGPQSNEVVDYVFANWFKFTGKVGSEKGIELLPQSPAVGFVLQHYEIALQLIAKGNSQQQPDEKLTNKFDKPGTVCNPVETKAEEKYVPTAEDLQNAFEQLAAVSQKG